MSNEYTDVKRYYKVKYGDPRGLEMFKKYMTRQGGGSIKTLRNKYTPIKRKIEPKKRTDNQAVVKIPNVISNRPNKLTNNIIGLIPTTHLRITSHRHKRQFYMK